MSEGANAALRAPFGPSPGGRRPSSVEDILADQHRRICGAMMDAVAENGYASVKITDVTRRAGVSNSTFYAHFSSKEECFLTTCDELVAMGAAHVARVYASAHGDWRKRLRTGLLGGLELLAALPEPAQVVFVNSLSLGPSGIHQRRQAMDTLEQILRDSLAHAPRPGPLADPVIRSIVAGVLLVGFRFLRRGDPEALPTLADGLIAWTASYVRASATAPLPEVLPVAGPARPRPAALGTPDARAAYPSRERIQLAIVTLTQQAGYEGLTIPAISRLAGVSNQTFYSHFDRKEDAFLATFDEVSERAIAAAAAGYASAPTWPRSVYAGLHALLAFFDAEADLAPLPLLGVFTGPPAGLDRATAVMDAFTQSLAPGFASTPKLPGFIADAIFGGLWHLIHEEIAARYDRPLTALAPRLAYLALVPFVSPKAATTAIQQQQAAIAARD